MNLSISFAMDRVNQDLTEYLKVCKKLPEAAIRKQSDEFGMRLYQELRKISPLKGSLIRQGELLLDQRIGVRVRPAILSQLAGKYEVAPMGGKALFRRRRRVLGGGTESVGAWRGSVSQGGRRLNLQALAVKAELNLREKSRGFLAVAGRFVRLGARGTEGQTVSRYGGVLGRQLLFVEGEGATARFDWGESGVASLAAAAGLEKPKAEAAIAAALEGTSENMRQYIRDKARGFGRKASA